MLSPFTGEVSSESVGQNRGCDGAIPYVRSTPYCMRRREGREVRRTVIFAISVTAYPWDCSKLSSNYG